MGVLAVSAACVIVLLNAFSASAHVELQSSDPASGAVLHTQPTSITLTFVEPVEVNDGVIEVFDDRFNPVVIGHVTSIDPAATRIRVGLRPGLAAGTYTVSWHATSEDTHVVSDSFQFSVVHPSEVRGAAPRSGLNDLAGNLLGVLRWTGYLGLLLGPGALLIALALWPAGLADRRTRGLTITGLCLLMISTLGTMALQGVWASGAPFTALWLAPETLDTHSRQFDQIYALRSYLLLGFALALLAALSRSVRVPTRSRRVLLAATTVSTVALLATWPLVGHSAAGAGAGFAIAANLLHTFAMSVWLGGLALILVALRPAERAAELASVLPRFSHIALAAVATLVITGVFMAWRQVGSVNALTATTFGQLLLVKMIGVIALVLVSNLARLWVTRNVVKRLGGGHLDGSATPHAHSVDQPVTEESLVGGNAAILHRGLMAEATIALGILAITAALVMIAPPR